MQFTRADEQRRDELHKLSQEHALSPRHQGELAALDSRYADFIEAGLRNLERLAEQHGGGRASGRGCRGEVMAMAVVAVSGLLTTLYCVVEQWQWPEWSATAGEADFFCVYHAVFGTASLALTALAGLGRSPVGGGGFSIGARRVRLAWAALIVAAGAALLLAYFPMSLSAAVTPTSPKRLGASDGAASPARTVLCACDAASSIASMFLLRPLYLDTRRP